MKDQQYESLWKEKIEPALGGLSESRKKERIRSLSIFFAGVGIVMAMFALEFVKFPWWIVIAGVIIVYVSYRVFIRMDNDFRNEFKQEVFGALNDIATLDWSGPTDLAAYSGAELLEESGLYHGYDNVSDDDKLRSLLDSATIDVCELTAHLEVRDRPIRTLFQGFLARISIDKPFSGATYVQTQADGSIVDSGAGGFFDVSKDVEETELEWGEFGRFLKVKSSDPAEAREIFTPDFMAVLYDWWRTHDESLRLSFRKKAMYIAFPTDIDLEPALMGKIENEKPVVRDILEFMLMLEELTKLLIVKQHRRYE